MDQTPKNLLDRLLPSTEFTFDLGDDIVTAWGSWVTALEIISVNDEIVSRKRSLRFCTPHEFTLRGTAYRLELRLLGPTYTSLRADLWRSETLVEQQHASLVRDAGQSPIPALLGLLVCGLIGAVIGFGTGFGIGAAIELFGGGAGQ